MRTLPAALVACLMIGAHGAALAQAKPAAKADAAKAAAPKGPSAEEKAMNKAVASYNKKKGMGADKGMGAASMDKPAAMKK